MIIIVEGMHNAGKSTLIEKMLASMSIKSFKCRRLFPDLTNARNSNITGFAFGVNCSIVWFAQNIEMNVVFDRLHLSEFAYSTSIRGVNEEIAFSEFKAIDTELAKTNCKIVALDLDYDKIIERLKEKNKVYNKTDYDILKRQFEKVYTATKIDMITINTTRLNENQVFEKTMNFLGEPF